MRGSKLGAAVCAIGGIVLLIMSIIERDSGVLLWMPLMFYAGMILLLVATFFLTYSPEEARAARERRDAEANESGSGTVN